MTLHQHRPALDGLRVVERTAGGAGQVAGMLLADLGADVVRLLRDGDLEADIERTGRPGWLCWNRGKRLAAEPSDIDDLLQRADLLITDDVPSDHVGGPFDAASLRRRLPALVSVWMPATGARGRWRDLPHDQLLLDALGGFAAHHPATAEVPVASVVPLRHCVQGALGAVAGLAGLLERRESGWGRSVTVTGLHAVAATLNTLVSRSVEGQPVVSPGKFLPGSPNFRLYQAGDGEWLYLAALSPELFIAALEVLDRLDLLAHPDIAGDFLNVLKPEVGASVGAELDAAFATAGVDDWLGRFADARVPACAVGRPEEWLSSEIVAHACPPLEREHGEVGAVTMPGTPLHLSVSALGPRLLTTETLHDAATMWTDVEPLPAPSGEPPGRDDRPLDGLKVIDLATYLAAPFVSTLLASHGADVVKIEAPSGDPYSVFSAPYACVNEHKPRCALDLSTSDGRGDLLDLVAHADVVVDNLVAASWRRLGLAHQDFEDANPGLVRCSVTAFGADGPYSNNPGFDPIMQTLSGLVSVQGGDGRPVATAAPVHDVATGAVGAVGTLAALWARPRSGGQRVLTSLAANSTFLQSTEMTRFDGRPDRRVGGPDFSGPHPWQRYYRAADRWFAVSAATDEQRTAFAAVVQRHGGDPASASELFGRRDHVDWVDEFAAAGVPACPCVRRLELDHPFLIENDYSHVVDTERVGRLEVVSGYSEWQDHPRRPPLDVAELAADMNDVVRRWAGRGATR